MRYVQARSALTATQMRPRHARVPEASDDVTGEVEKDGGEGPGLSEQDHIESPLPKRDVGHDPQAPEGKPQRRQAQEQACSDGQRPQLCYLGCHIGVELLRGVTGLSRSSLPKHPRAQFRQVKGNTSARR
jgi:hypothetical protein